MVWHDRRVGWEVQGLPILGSKVRRICPTVCPNQSLKCNVPTENGQETRLEGKSGTRLRKSLDAMSGNRLVKGISLFFRQMR